MKIILLEDVHGLGFKEDVVTVKNGYGRNYLIPNKKAILATDSALKVREENLKQRAHKLAKIKAEAEALAAQLNGLTLTIGTKASSTGKIFGSQAAAHRRHADAAERRGRPGGPGGAGPRPPEHHPDLHPRGQRRFTHGRPGQSPGKGEKTGKNRRKQGK